MIDVAPTSAWEVVRLEKALRVLTITPFYPVRGDETLGCFVAEPLSQMDRFGVKNTTFAVRPFYRGRAVAADDAASARWVHFLSIPTGLGLSSAGALLYMHLGGAVRRLHRSQPLDLIHAHSALPSGHAAALLSQELGIPFVVSIHGLDAFFTRQVTGFVGQLCARVAAFVYRSASTVICVSERVREQVEGHLGTWINAALVYNGVNPELFFPPRDEISIDTILSVGNLIPVKGHELLMRAFAAVRKRHPRARWEIIGEGPERGRLQRLACELGVYDQVHFMGRQTRNQVAEAMRRCAIFALPSRFEGLGCVYLEAMCSGKPVIACQGQGIAEVIQHGVNGWLVEPNNLEELTESLAVLLREREQRRRLGEAARQTVLQGYTLDHQAARLAATYRSCLS